jgi:hypothetical protein
MMDQFLVKTIEKKQTKKRNEAKAKAASLKNEIIVDK